MWSCHYIQSTGTSLKNYFHEFFDNSIHFSQPSFSNPSLIYAHYPTPLSPSLKCSRSNSCCQTTLGYGTWPRVWLVNQVSHCKGKVAWPLLEIIKCQQLLSWVELRGTPSLHAGILSGLSYRSCASCAVMRVNMYSCLVGFRKNSFLEIIHHLCLLWSCIFCEEPGTLCGGVWYRSPT